MIVKMQCIDYSVMETANYLGRARSAVSAVMTAYTNSGKMLSVKSTVDRKESLLRRIKESLPTQGSESAGKVYPR